MRIIVVVASLLLGLSTIILSQEFYKVIPEDSIYNGDVQIVLENTMSNEIVLQYNYSKIEERRAKYKIAKITTSGELNILKDFSEQHRWPSGLGNEVKIANGLIYYADREWKKEEPNPDSLAWYYGVMDMDGHTLIEKKFNFRSRDWRVTFLYGMHLVGNDDVILWGVGTPPWNDPKINNPYVLWLRLKRDGTLVSGPHYYKPELDIRWAQPTDGAIDRDSNLVLVYDSREADSRKFGLKILPNDSIEIAFLLDYEVKSPTDDFSCIAIAKNGDYIVTKPDQRYARQPRLSRINKENVEVWESGFDRPTRKGIMFGPENTKFYYTQKIIETANEDIIICGLNNISDSFYVAGTNDQVFSQNRSGSFIARFSKEGELLWVHHMAYVVEDGSLHYIRLRDVIELQDGRLCVGGSLGIEGTKIDMEPFVMFLDANGCKDENCSNVDKWWYFPDLIPRPPIDTLDTEIDTLAILPHVVVYPNPTSEFLNIHIPQKNDFLGIVQSYIFDSQGRQIRTDVLALGINTVDVSQWSQGSYFLIIQDEAGQQLSIPWIKF